MLVYWRVIFWEKYSDQPGWSSQMAKSKGISPKYLKGLGIIVIYSGYWMPSVLTNKICKNGVVVFLSSEL